jgi:hypothetical protein
MVDEVKVPEEVRGPEVPDQDLGKPGTAVLADPTQVRRPWRSTARTIFQAAIALATRVPLISAEVYADADAAPAAVAQVLVVAGVVTRVMALPGVETFLRRFVPFLAASSDPV